MQLTSRQTTTLLVSVFIIAICGLVYELIVGTLSSYLFGNSVVHFSITIGLFMSAMGLGSFASRWVRRHTLRWFVLVEVGIGVVGGSSAFLLYAVFATTELYHVAMVTLILLVGGFVGMEIPLLTRLVQGQATLKDTLANVLAFDYLGALLGAILFPIVLLPYLGLLQTSFAVGVLNLLVALLILWTFRTHLQGARWLTAVSLTAILLLAAGGVQANRLTSFFERQLYADDVIYTAQTPYQRIVMTRWREDVRLYLDGQLQFSLQDEYRYHEPLVHPAMTLTRSREQVLVLGGGDGLAVRELLKYEDVQRIVLVDIDPAMTDLARTHPTLRDANGDALHDPRLHLVHQDAFTYLEETADLFGVIILDLPDPNNETLGKLYSREFYRLVQRHLAIGGMMAAQATSPYFAREAYWSIVHTVQDVGLQTVPYHAYVPSFGEWGFLLAAAHEIPVNAYRPQVPVRFLTPEVLAGGLVFDQDMAEVDTAVNTLDTQVVLAYYQQGWRQWR